MAPVVTTGVSSVEEKTARTHHPCTGGHANLRVAYLHQKKTRIVRVILVQEPR